MELNLKSNLNLSALLYKLIPNHLGLQLQTNLQLLVPLNLALMELLPKLLLNLLVDQLILQLLLKLLPNLLVVHKILPQHHLELHQKHLLSLLVLFTQALMKLHPKLILYHLVEKQCLHHNLSEVLHLLVVHLNLPLSLSVAHLLNQQSLAARNKHPFSLKKNNHRNSLL